jgi:hypothetical protein
MPLTGLVEVAIGVVFVWFLLSLIISAVNEAFTWATRLRSKLLWQSLARLFESELKAPEARLRDLAVRLPGGKDDHRPTSSGDPSALSNLRASSTRPATTTASPPLQQLYDVLKRRVADPAPGSWRTRISSIGTDALSDALLGVAEATVTKASLLATTNDLELTTFIQGLSDGPLDKATVEGAVPTDKAAAFDAVWNDAERVVTIEDLEALLAGNSSLSRSLKAIRKNVDPSQQLGKARDEIGRWFDSSMDALTTFYRRQSRKIAAVIALPLVLLTNANSFDLYHRLRGDQDLQTAASSSAATWVAQPLNSSGSTASIDLGKVCARATVAAASSGTTSAPTTSTATSTGATGPAQAIDEARRRLDCARGIVASSSLLTFIGPRGFWHELRATDSGGLRWLWDGLVGRAVTWAALLFGAGFWYDVLRRLVGLKGGSTKVVKQE